MICNNDVMKPFNASLSDYFAPLSPVLPESPYNTTAVNFQTITFYAIASFMVINTSIIILLSIRKGVEKWSERKHARSNSFQKKLDSFKTGSNDNGASASSVSSASSSGPSYWNILVSFVAGMVWMCGMALEWDMMKTDFICRSAKGFSCILIKFWLVKVFGFTLWMLAIHQNLFKLLILLRFPRSPALKSYLYYGIVMVINVSLGLAAHFDRAKSSYLINHNSQSMIAAVPIGYLKALDGVTGIGRFSWCIETTTWTIIRICATSLTILFSLLLSLLLWSYRGSFKEISKQIPYSIASCLIHFGYLTFDGLFATSPTVAPITDRNIIFRLLLKQAIILSGMMLVSIYIWSQSLPRIMDDPVCIQQKLDEDRKRSTFGHLYVQNRFSSSIQNGINYLFDSTSNGGSGTWKPRISTATANFLQEGGNVFHQQPQLPPVISESAMESEAMTTREETHDDDNDFEMEERANRIFSRAMGYGEFDMKREKEKRQSSASSTIFEMDSIGVSSYKLRDMHSGNSRRNPKKETANSSSLLYFK